jgi:hypothetical protein
MSDAERLRPAGEDLGNAHRGGIIPEREEHEGL